MIWMRAKVIYEDGKKVKFKNAMLCANHSRCDDPILIQCIFWYKKIHSLATTDLYNTKMKNFFFSRVNCIPVDKKNFSMDSFHAVCDKLNKGEAVLIFPEGGVTTGEENELKALKSGVALMAYQTKSPIIPIYIVPPKKWYNRRVAVVGQPFTPSELFGTGLSGIEKTTAMLQERELALKELYYRNTKKETDNDL